MCIYHINDKVSCIEIFYISCIIHQSFQFILLVITFAQIGIDKILFLFYLSIMASDIKTEIYSDAVLLGIGCLIVFKVGKPGQGQIRFLKLWVFLININIIYNSLILSH